MLKNNVARHPLIHKQCEALKKNNQELKVLHKLHQVLAKSADPDNILDIAAQTIRSDLMRPEGLIYYFNKSSGVLSGYIWQLDKAPQNFSIKFDKNGLPDKMDTAEIKDDLSRLIKTSYHRASQTTAESCGNPRIISWGPYIVIPLMLELKVAGEIAVLKDKRDAGTDELTEGGSDLNAFLGAVIESALARAVMFKKDKETREALKLALSKKHALEKLIEKSSSERDRLELEIIRNQKIESMSLMVSGMVHDFNNILTTISGGICLAKMYLTSEDKAFKKLEQAEKAFVQAKDLTRQFLSFSKKGGAPVKKTVQVSELIKDACNLILTGSKAQCECSVADNLLPVEADKGQLSQVINNILINAKQAMPEGGTIWVTSRNVTLTANNNLRLNKGKYIKITIKDQGIGIPKKDLMRIFDPYFTTKDSGSGLGLSTSYSIVKKHGGTILVESRIDMGSTFWILLPASDKMAIKPTATQEKPVVGKERILIMDDEEEIRSLVGEMLESIGYKVGFAKDGEEAIETIRFASGSDSPFDVAILDLTIPGGMGGREAIKKLREICPELKAIVSSGYTSDPVMVDFRKHGFNEVIAKPYEIGQLSKILHETLNQGAN
jgi:signal transduction histidine kinase/CheY-like chemotaxis protein